MLYASIGRLLTLCLLIVVGPIYRIRYIYYLQVYLFIICLLLSHRFYYGNSYNKIRALFMPICTENGCCWFENVMSNRVHNVRKLKIQFARSLNK